MTGADYFATSVDHLLAQLETVDLLMRAHAQRVLLANNEKQAFDRLYISDDEIVSLCSTPILPSSLVDMPPAVEPAEVEAELLVAPGDLDNTILVSATWHFGGEEEWDF